MSSLLALPGEIRNKIYQFVLTSPDALRYRESSKRIQKPIFYSLGSQRAEHGDENEQSEFNELKYVNKQLYNETAALELKYNVLRFNGHPSDKLPAIANLTNFLGSIATTRKAWLRTIMLDDCIPPPSHGGTESFYSKPIASATAIASLSHACRQNPHIRVRYVLSYWANNSLRKRKSAFLLQGLYLAEAIRQQHHCPLIFGAGTPTLNLFMRDIANETGRWRGDVPASAMQAPNLRFMPSEDTTWNWHDWHSYASSIIVQDIYQVLALTEGWVRDGI